MMQALAVQALTDWWRGSPESGKRSGQWPALRKRWLAQNPRCAACGTLKEVEVHHVRPVHIVPELELEWANLLTLCRRDHLLVGHLDDWKSFNIEVAADAAHLLERITRRPAVARGR